jgi:hypothetical protein
LQHREYKESTELTEGKKYCKRYVTMGEKMNAHYLGNTK